MIPRTATWRVTYHFDRPQGSTVSEKRHYYVLAPTKFLAKLAMRDEIGRIGAAEFYDNVTRANRVTYYCMRRPS